MPSSISVVIPAYNCQRYIGTAIESVLEQSLKANEIIVVDDGSQDRTVSIASSYPQVFCLPEPHGGPARARNVGIAASSGDLIAFLDADDLWGQDKLLLQVNALKADGDLHLVFGHVDEFLSPDIEFNDRKVIARRNMPGVVAGTLLAKRDAFDKAGMFCENLRVGEFIDWYMKTKELGLKMRLIDEVLTMRRIHDANLVSADKAAAQDYAVILKASLDRRRKVDSDAATT